LVDDRFRLLTPLGPGHSGQVWHAVDERTGRPVAVKIHFGHPGTDAASVVRHPCVVSIFFLGTHEGAAYSVMELVDGVSLAAVLLDGPVPAADATVITMGICDALHAAHRAGVVHGNLKPSNVLIADAGGGQPVVKVGDFSGHGDPRDDMYSVGLLMEAMAGRRDPVIGRMLSRDPYSPAQLRAILTGAAVPAASLEDGPDTDRRGLRRLAVISGAATLAVVVAGCVWMFQPAAPPDFIGAPGGEHSALAGSPSTEPSVAPRTSTPPPVVAPAAGASLNALHGVKAVIAHQLKAGNIEREAAASLDSRLDDIIRFQSRGQTKQAGDRIDALKTQLGSMRRANKVTAAGYDAILASVNGLSGQP
jgi:serine/threonine protein kinase